MRRDDAASLGVMRHPLAEPKRVLIVQFRRLGDVVLSTALLETLAHTFPNARRDYVVGAQGAPLVRGHPLIDNLLEGNEKNPVGMLRTVRANRYDWIIDAQSTPGTAQLTFLSGAPVRAGWGLRGWSALYTHVLPRDGRPAEYAGRERQRLLELLGVPYSGALPRLHLTEDERLQGEQELGLAGAPAPRVGLVVSASMPSKEWRIEGFAEVADSLTDLGIAPVIFQFPGDEQKVAAVRARSRSAVVLPVDDARQFLQLVSGCSALVAGDTGPVHMATALDIPTVTIYGPYPPLIWNPGLPTTVALLAEGVPCLGCHFPRCPIGHDCMVGVTSTMVMNALNSVMLRPVASGSP